MKPSSVIKEPYGRTRTRGLFYPVTRTSQWYNTTSSPIPAPVPSTVSFVRGKTEQMMDFVTPAFKDLVKEGRIVNNDMEKITWERSTTTSGPKFEITTGGVTYYGDLVGPCWVEHVLTDVTRPSSRPILSINVQNMIDLAATRALANIDKPDFSGFVTLGELRETLSYLMNPLKGGIKLANSLARMSRRGITKDLAGVYLGVMYGAKPLISEISSILENLRPREIPRPQRRTARAKEERVLTDSWITQEVFSGISYIATYEWEEKVTVTVGYLYDHKTEACTEEHWGTRPRDVALAAWAVMSKSFLVDWFVNFGDFISALTPSANTRILSAWTTTRTTTILKRTVANYAFSTWSTSRPGTGQCIVKRERVERLHYAPPPTLAFKDLDPLKNDISRITSMVAILTGTMKSGGNPPVPTIKSKTGAKLPPSSWY